MAVKTETRAVADFDQIELRYSGELHITQGEATALTVEADEEVLPKLITEVRGHTLVLELSGDWLERLWGGVLSFGRAPVKYRVTVKELRSLKVSGYGTVNTPELQAERLELTLSGYGKVELGALNAVTLSVTISGRGEFSAKGAVKEQTVFISGSGNYHAKELTSEKAGVRVSGHGNVTLAVSNTLEVGISGYGKVDYLGSPAVSQTISGGGRVKQVTA